MKKIKVIKDIYNVLEVFLMIYWLSVIIKTDAYYITYLVVGIFSFISLYIKHFKKANEKISKKNNIIFISASIIYSLIVILANYQIISSILNGIIIALGAFISFYNILKYVLLDLSQCKFNIEENKNKPIKIFLIFALIIFVFYVIFLVFAYYPGVLTPDSVNQLTQIKNGKYSNHHPYYHTIIIKQIIDLGMKLFNNINSAIMLYSVFQILIVSLSIAYCICTLYQMNIPKKYIIISFFFYLLMPYNIIYSFTMWKDIFFALCVLIFLVTLFRIIYSIGKKQVLNYILLFVSSIGFMLFRSNGMIALVATYIFMILILRKTNIKLLLLLLVAIVVAFILKGPVLKIMKIENADFVESLSIPLQQVARVIKDDKKISKEQYEELSKIINVENIPEKYSSYISDPIKWEIRNFGNQEYLVKNKSKFLKIYLELGIKYPLEYIYAWVDQTRGYWNGGYKYWIWNTGVAKNDLGVERTVVSQNVNKAIEKYLNIFDRGNAFSLFVSIGFNSWILMLLFIVNILNKRKQALFVWPIIFLIGTLLIATPVFSEFRYIYAMFLTLPFIMFISFWNEEKYREKES